VRGGGVDPGVREQERGGKVGGGWERKAGGGKGGVSRGPGGREERVEIGAGDVGWKKGGGECRSKGRIR